MITTSYAKRIKRIVKEERKKIAFSLPFKLHYLLLPLFRYKMSWEILADAHRYRLVKCLGQNQFTLDASIACACHLFRLGRFFHQPHRPLFQYISEPNFHHIKGIYGDKFMSILLRYIVSDTLHYDDVALFPKRFASLIDFHSKKEIQHLFRSLDEEHPYRIVCDVTCAFENLFTDNALLNQYVALLTAQQVNQKKAHQIVKGMCTLSNNIGTLGAYQVFLTFCQKFHTEPHFGKLLNITNTIAASGNPDLFKKILQWANRSSLSISLQKKALENSVRLLNCDNDSLGVFYFQKYVHYLLEKEQSFSLLKEQDVGYYLEKAASFFLEE